ncbi:hypothetical protein FHW88_004856 [Mucilaginibacter sp. SG538B]|uniref:hypothetical protein n=1 Tax=unclassified Mucilaginibacter TaxID=2617802 RepID=UPI00159DE7AD|nr:hypothetical protein [Mucilaginibacter sp. SG538B]NVM66538.1 hypothetical protein [Mucilaginibacter sp. SG538B]
MKKFVFRFFFFSVFCSLFYVVLILLYGTIVPASFAVNFNYFGGMGFTRQRFDEVSKIKNVDLVVAGSSHAYRGYDPRIFKKSGISMFNLGSSSQSPLQTRYVLGKYVTKLKPKLVIVDVYPVLFGVDGLESQIDLISSGLIDKDIVALSFKINNIKLYNTLLFGAFNNEFHIKKQKLSDNQGDTYIPGGYVQSFRHLQFKKTRFKQNVNISATQLEAFKAGLNELRSQQIKFVIIQAPFSRSNYASYQNNDEIDRVFSSLGEYYNFNKILNLPDSMYYDDSHLNQRGVNIYNAKLIDTLSKRGHFRKLSMNN